MLKPLLPSRESLLRSPWLRWLGPRLHDPSLWSLNRRAVARGVAIGAFFGLMVPVAQIPAAAMVALLARANLLIAAAATLISNPLTYAPLYYLAYRLGALLIGHPDTPAPLGPGFEADGLADWLAQAWAWLGDAGAPLALGVVVLAVTASLVGYLVTHWVWRARVARRWRGRGPRMARDNA